MRGLIVDLSQGSRRLWKGGRSDIRRRCQCYHVFDGTKIRFQSDSKRSHWMFCRMVRGSWQIPYGAECYIISAFLHLTICSASGPLLTLTVGIKDDRSTCYNLHIHHDNRTSSKAYNQQTYRNAPIEQQMLKRRLFFHWKRYLEFWIRSVACCRIYIEHTCRASS